MQKAPYTSYGDSYEQMYRRSVKSLKPAAP